MSIFSKKGSETNKASGMDFDQAQQEAHVRISMRRPVNAMFSKMDDFWHNEWNWPNPTKPEWVHKVTSSDPHDALRSSTQILGSVSPQVKVHPLADDEQSKEHTDLLEKALQWQLNRLLARNRGNKTENVVQSALQYAMVTMQTIYLPYEQEKYRKSGDTMMQKRMKAAQAYGDFALIMRHPADVFPTSSEFLPVEDVIYRRVYTKPEFKATFPQWKKWEGSIDLDEQSEGFIIVFEKMNFEGQLLWAQNIPTLDNLDDVYSGTKIIDRKHGIDFLPWIVRSTGAEFYSDPDKQLKPLLYPVYKTGHWDIQNVVLSLLESEVISYAASPRGVVKSYNPWDIQVDYGDPGRLIRLSPEDEYQQIMPPGIDKGLGDALDILNSMIGKETVSRMIQNPEMKADVPFSAMNLIFQLGANTLEPFKKLSEIALADVCRQMLKWVHQDGRPLVSWSPKKGEEGMQIKIDPKDYDEDEIFITVKLTADVPTDKVAKVNAAVMMNKQLKYPAARAMEEVGVQDPQQAIKEWEEDQRREAALQLQIEKDRMQMEQMMQMQMQKTAAMAQQVEQMKMQNMQRNANPYQQPIPGGQQPMDMSGGAVGPPMLDQMSGQGFDTAMGGQPGIQGAPGATREAITGQTRAGGEIAM